VYFTAYEILSNPKKRKQYDDFGAEGTRNNQHSKFAYNFNFDDFMTQFDQHFGDFQHKFHSPTNKMHNKKTGSMFNFGNIFNASFCIFKQNICTLNYQMFLLIIG